MCIWDRSAPSAYPVLLFFIRFAVMRADLSQLSCLSRFVCALVICIPLPTFLTPSPSLCVPSLVPLLLHSFVRDICTDIHSPTGCVVDASPLSRSFVSRSTFCTTLCLLISLRPYTYVFSCSPFFCRFPATISPRFSWLFSSAFMSLQIVYISPHSSMSCASLAYHTTSSHFAHVFTLSVYFRILSVSLSAWLSVFILTLSSSHNAPSHG